MWQQKQRIRSSIPPNTRLEKALTVLTSWKPCSLFSHVPVWFLNSDTDYTYSCRFCVLQSYQIAFYYSRLLFSGNITQSVSGPKLWTNHLVDQHSSNHCAAKAKKQHFKCTQNRVSATFYCVVCWGSGNWRIWTGRDWICCLGGPAQSQSCPPWTQFKGGEKDHL